MANQTISLSIKEPPNPEPVRTLGIFALPVDLSIIEAFLSGVPAPAHDATFLGNVKDEVLKALAECQVLTVMRQDKILTITLRLP